MPWSYLNVPPDYCADLRLYCLHLLSYPDSLIHLWICDVALFCPHGVAIFVSGPVALLREVIPEWNARASAFALPRYLTTSVRLLSVDKEEGLFTCGAKHIVLCISVNMM